jgi:hypothetical protein
MRATVLLVLLLLTSCTSRSTPVAQETPTAAVSTSTTALTCRLPVTWQVTDGQAVATKRGFLSFRDKTVVEDQSAPPGSVFYDRAFAKWLPVPRTAVSVDGKQFAYGEGNAYQNTGGKLHVVDVATGQDTVIYSGSTVYNVVDFAAEGIYITGPAPEGYPRGLWLERPTGGSPQLISAGIVAPAVGAGAAWGLNFNNADPSPGPGGIEGPFNEVVRIDLSTGSTTTWFYRPGSTLEVLGFDRRGELFINAAFAGTSSDGSGHAYQLWLVASATVASRLYTGPDGQVSVRLAAVDDHGVWFHAQYASASSSTVWLYAGASLQVVATVNVGHLAVAGGCIP